MRWGLREVRDRRTHQRLAGARRGDRQELPLCQEHRDRLPLDGSGLIKTAFMQNPYKPRWHSVLGHQLLEAPEWWSGIVSRDLYPVMFPDCIVCFIQVPR